MEISINRDYQTINNYEISLDNLFNKTYRQIKYNKKFRSICILPLTFLDLNLLETTGKIRILENFKTLFHTQFLGLGFSVGHFLVIGLILAFLLNADILINWRRKKNCKDFLLTIAITLGLLLMMLW